MRKFLFPKIQKAYRTEFKAKVVIILGFVKNYKNPGFANCWLGYLEAK